jgi:hypothetical protein
LSRLVSSPWHSSRRVLVSSLESRSIRAVQRTTSRLTHSSVVGRDECDAPLVSSGVVRSPSCLASSRPSISSTTVHSWAIRPHAMIAPTLLFVENSRLAGSLVPAMCSRTSPLKCRTQQQRIAFLPSTRSFFQMLDGLPAPPDLDNSDHDSMKYLKAVQDNLFVPGSRRNLRKYPSSGFLDEYACNTMRRAAIASSDWWPAYSAWLFRRRPGLTS